MEDASNHLDNPQTPARAKNKQLDVEQNRQTPRKADSTQRRNYQLPTKEFRKLVLKTMGVTIPELTLNHFFEGSVPEVPEKVVDATWKELQRMKREDGSSVIAAETGRWSWYERDPGNMSEDEDVVYKHMEGIWDAILDAAKKSWPGKKCTARLRCRPTFPSKSETQNSNFKTDGDVERLSNDEARQGTARQQKMAERKKPAEQKKIPSDRDRPDAYDSVVHLEFKKALTLEGANQV
ncbi:hypothetical protein V5O48_016156 [Marasmius crinis-equi]|uniref:Uncharacterized protein n=1 Tax=Marasmius crinis-equi TaxID=585013 RepID=A0ABR3ESK3_9AGAR